MNADAVVVDEEELRCHQKLQDLYSSTKAAKVRNLLIFLRLFLGQSQEILISSPLVLSVCKGISFVDSKVSLQQGRKL